MRQYSLAYKISLLHITASSGSPSYISKFPCSTILSSFTARTLYSAPYGISSSTSSGIPSDTPSNATSSALYNTSSDGVPSNTTSDVRSSAPSNALGSISVHNFGPILPSESIKLYQRFQLTSKLSVEEFHRVEFCAVQQSSTSQVAKAIVDAFDDSEKFSSLLFSSLFYLLKRGQDLSNFAKALFDMLICKQGDLGEYSVRMLINVLLSNCSRFLRQKIIGLLSYSNAVPLTELTLTKDGTTFNQEFILEPYWLLEEKFLFLSYGIDHCKGKSSLLNHLFGTTFEISNGSIYFKGTIDYQGDKMFIPARDMMIVDAHGILSETVKNRVLQLADGVILQIDHRTWNGNRELVCKEVDMLLKCNLRCVMVLIRDVAELKHKKNSAALNPIPLSEVGVSGTSSVPLLLVYNLHR